PMPGSVGAGVYARSTPGSSGGSPVGDVGAGGRATGPVPTFVIGLIGKRGFVPGRVLGSGSMPSSVFVGGGFVFSSRRAGGIAGIAGLGTMPGIVVGFGPIIGAGPDTWRSGRTNSLVLRSMCISLSRPSVATSGALSRRNGPVPLLIASTP